MDTLASPSVAAREILSPSELLRARARWRRFGVPLIGLNAGLLLTLMVLWKLHPSWLRVDAPGQVPLAWACGLGATFFTGFALWAVRHRAAPLQGARSLDENLRAMNRLEATAVLESQVDPISQAQREETAAFLAGHGTTQRGPDYLRILILVFAALVFAHLATLAVWTRPWQRALPAPIKAAPTPPPAAPPKASITWKTPKSEIKASPVEEVPLEAMADSASGLRDLVLEVAVNGEPSPATPIPADMLTKPGTHPIQASLYLDQVNAQPYDMVSYFLRAKRIVKGTLPDIVSPVQFVEIKPFRDDVREVPGGNSDLKGLFDFLTALKVAQLNLLKQNFVLGHAEISRENPSWKKENARVGDEQGNLGTKADEVVAQFIQKGLPAEIVDLLQQSRTLMADAADKIHGTKNTEALAVQGKSLGLITEIEKFFIKLAAKDGKSKGGPKEVKDPFEIPKNFELKQRFDTIAGGLEDLAQAQLKLAQELAKADPKDPDAGKPTPEPPGAEPKKPDPNRIEGTFTERQTLISQRIGALLNQPFPPEVVTHLGSAHDHARESLRQLDADDIAQAREPATATARELRLAIQTMDQLGENTANDKLAEALNRLNQAADEARSTADAKSDDAAKKAADEAAVAAADARDKLAEAARQQQEAGSAEAAARLADAVHALDDQKLRDALKRLHDQPRSEAAANAAAEQLAHAADQVADKQGNRRSADEIAQLVERVERTRRNFEHLAAAQTGDNANHPTQDTATHHSTPNLSPAISSSGEKAKESAPGQPQGKDALGPGRSDQSTKTPSHPHPDGQDKAAQNPDGKGETSGGKDGNGQAPAATQGKEGQGQGQKGKGKGGKGPGHEEGQGQGEGQTPAQGGDGKAQGSGPGTGESFVADQPTSEQTDQGSGTGTSSGGGHGSGKADTNTADYDPNAPTSATNGASPKASGQHPDAHGRSEANHVRGPGDDGQSSATERETQELMADLRDESLDARTILVSADARGVLEELHPDIHSPRPRNNVSVVASFERVRGPMDHLITLLRVELERAQRQHELTDQTQEKAPPAYGEAVADYFDQLSHDYQPGATPAPAVAPEAAPSP